MKRPDAEFSLFPLTKNDVQDIGFIFGLHEDPEERFYFLWNRLEQVRGNHRGVYDFLRLTDRNVRIDQLSYATGGVVTLPDIPPKPHFSYVAGITLGIDMLFMKAFAAKQQLPHLGAITRKQWSQEKQAAAFHEVDLLRTIVPQMDSPEKRDHFAKQMLAMNRFGNSRVKTILSSEPVLTESIVEHFDKKVQKVGTQPMVIPDFGRGLADVISLYKA